MAQFCTKCGTALPEGMNFCLACGAAIREPSASPAAAPPAGGARISGLGPPAAASTSTSPTTPSGSPIVKMILAVLALLFFFALLGIGASVYLSYRIRQKVRRLEKQGQSFLPRRDSDVPAAAIEVPVYLGATATDDGPAVSGESGAFKLQPYVTDDARDEVLNFYQLSFTGSPRPSRRIFRGES